MNGDSFYVNTLQNGIFTGWQIFNGEHAQTHSVNFSNGGKVGISLDRWNRSSLVMFIIWNQPIMV